MEAAKAELQRVRSGTGSGISRVNEALNEVNELTALEDKYLSQSGALK